MNVYDEVINFFSPSAGLQRAKARAASDAVRSYEAASRGRRTDDWGATGTSASAETRKGGALLRDRSRELDRNNPYGRKAIQVITNNTVGAGIRISFKADNKLKDTYNSTWNDWADSTSCDFDGRLNFYGIQRLVMRTVAMSGEALVIKQKIKYVKGEVPLQLQVLEADYIDTLRVGVKGTGNYIFEGIEFNAKGQRVGYWLFENHPGNEQIVTKNTVSTFVSAKDVIHVFDRQRPGQERGVPFGAPSMIVLKDLKDYQDAELLKQKVAACFSVFVTDGNPDNIQSSNGTRSDLVDIEPGQINYLEPGESIEFAEPPSTTGYGEHTKRLLQSAAAGFGVTYEALTGDMSMTNFSSGRMGWLEFHRQITDWQLNMLIPQLCEGVWSWFNQAAVIAGLLPKMVKVEWTSPRREMIDPVKEISGIVSQVRAGLMTYSEAVRELGYDPDSVLKELVSDMEKIKTGGLILDLDGRNDLMKDKAAKG